MLVIRIGGKMSSGVCGLSSKSQINASDLILLLNSSDLALGTGRGQVANELSLLWKQGFPDAPTMLFLQVVYCPWDKVWSLVKSFPFLLPPWCQNQYLILNGYHHPPHLNCCKNLLMSLPAPNIVTLQSALHIAGVFMSGSQIMFSPGLQSSTSLE